MSAPVYTIAYTEPRRRLTTLLRYPLAIPHIVIMNVWQNLAQILAFFQWWVILFTGRRNEGIWKLQSAWLGYAARVSSYESLMFDEWPNIGAEPNGEPTTYSFAFEAPANRLTNFFRLLWLIPSLIVAIVVLVGAAVCTIVAWFAILFTGRHPRGLFDFVVKVHSFMVGLNACALLMTDTRPRFGA